MATRKEIQDQIAQLQADLEGADDDDVELLVEHPKTKAIGRLKGQHAQSFLDSILGTSDDGQGGKKGAGKKGADDQDDDDGQDDGQDDDDQDDAPPARQSVWGRR